MSRLNVIRDNVRVLKKIVVNKTIPKRKYNIFKNYTLQSEINAIPSHWFLLSFIIILEDGTCEMN